MVYEKGGVIPISKKSNWQGDKKMTTMLCWRTIAEGCRAMMPEAFLGMKIADEVEEEVGEIVSEVEVHEPGGEQSEDFSGSSSGPAEEGEVMMENAQLDELIALSGSKAKALAVIRGHFGKEKTGKNTTAKEAQAVIDYLKSEVDKATTPAPVPETQPETKTEAGKSKEEEDRERIEKEIDEDIFKEEMP